MTASASATDAVTGPAITPVAPTAGQSNVAPSVPIIFDVVAGPGLSIAPGSVTVTVDDTVAWEREAPINGWAGTAQRQSESRQRYWLFAPEGFEYGASVNVQADSPPLATTSWSFDVERDPVCAVEAPSALALKLLEPLPLYALEQLRVRFLFNVTTTHDLVSAARRTLQMAFDTEVGTILAKVVTVLDAETKAVVCVARRYLDIDADMRAFSFLIGPAIDAVAEASFLPVSYVNLFRTYVESPYPRYRVSTLAALLVVAAVFLNPQPT